MEMHKQRSYLRIKDIAQILKKHEGMAAHTVEFHAAIKLLFLWASILNLIEKHNIMLY